VEALGPAQRRGSGIGPRHGMRRRSATAALFEVLLEARRQRQPVDQIQTDAAEDGELGEMAQRVHAAQPVQGTEQADGRRRQTGTSGSQVVETPTGQRLGNGRLNELGDGGATVTLRLSVEAEHTYTHTNKTVVDNRLRPIHPVQLTMSIFGSLFLQNLAGILPVVLVVF